MAESLDVLLGDTPVGQITNIHGDRNVFAFDDRYRSDPRRPILSQSFIDREGELVDVSRPVSRKAPPFFANLLPEAHLRQYIAQHGNVNETRDFPLLWLLGGDLPGAVVIRDAAGRSLPPEDDRTERAAGEAREGMLRFSLAGVQLKFSAVIGADGGLAIPAQGAGGHWIVKLPSAIYSGVPENEYSMLTFARSIGIDVPDIGLIDTEKVAGLPPDMRHDMGQAMFIKRFDRADGGARIHVEDFNQIFGQYPEAKYKHVSYTGMSAAIWQMMGQEGVDEFVRRLVFSMGIGNGDMHLKNWSVTYADEVTPRLAPAYDYVNTVRYLPADRLALNLAGTREWEDFDLDRFERFAAKSKVSARAVRRVALDTVDRMRDTWPRIEGELPADDATKRSVEAQMRRIPLFAGRQSANQRRA